MSDSLSKEREKGYPHPTVTVKRLWAFIRKGKQRVSVRQINTSVLKTCTKHKASLRWNNISASADLAPLKGCLYKEFSKEIPTDWQRQFDLSGCCVWYDIYGLSLFVFAKAIQRKRDPVYAFLCFGHCIKKGENHTHTQSKNRKAKRKGKKALHCKCFSISFLSLSLPSLTPSEWSDHFV